MPWLCSSSIRAGLVATDGQPKHSGFHALRNFYASWCINRKADGGLELPIKVVQGRLGQSSIQMTAGHLFPHGDDVSELADARRQADSADVAACGTDRLHLKRWRDPPTK
jgi:integrase